MHSQRRLWFPSAMAVFCALWTIDTHQQLRWHIMTTFRTDKHHVPCSGPTAPRNRSLSFCRSPCCTLPCTSLSPAAETGDETKKKRVRKQKPMKGFNLSRLIEAVSSTGRNKYWPEFMSQEGRSNRPARIINQEDKGFSIHVNGSSFLNVSFDQISIPLNLSLVQILY